jgi:hypothetical protein
VDWAGLGVSHGLVWFSQELDGPVGCGGGLGCPVGWGRGLDWVAGRGQLRPLGRAGLWTGSCRLGWVGSSLCPTDRMQFSHLQRPLGEQVRVAGAYQLVWASWGQGKHGAG